MKNFRLICLILLSCWAFLVLPSCRKGWLEEKRDLALVVPTTLKDMRALLNNYFVFGADNIGATFYWTDEYYLPQKIFESKALFARDLYTWRSGFFDTMVDLSEWNDSYHQIFYANNILAGLDKIERIESNRDEWDDIKGGALFYRAKANFNLAQIFSQPLGDGINENSLGIPLKLSADINAETKRAGLTETYNRIISDLKESAHLLKAKPLRKTDSSKPAAYGMLARIYLSMNEYKLAQEYADSCLLFHSTLMDYNEIEDDKAYPFLAMNEEVIFQSKLNPQYISFTDLKIDTILYSFFSEKDIRRNIFFQEDNDGTYNFKGTYHGDFNMFSGIATDEIYLIKAECLARQGKLNEAIEVLNTLLVTRYEKDSFIAYQAMEQSNVLELVLLERRKQLMFRGLRWLDLRRFIQEDNAGATLKRFVGNETHELLPSAENYIFPIPNKIIELTGIEQN